MTRAGSVPESNFLSAPWLVQAGAALEVVKCAGMWPSQLGSRGAWRTAPALIVGSGQLRTFSVEDELLFDVLELDLCSASDWEGGVVTSGGARGGPGAPGAGFHNHAAAAPPAPTTAPAATATRTVAPVLSVVVTVVPLLIEANPERVVGVKTAISY